MSRTPGKVEYFRHGGDRKELARLERLTGLRFESVPESLLRMKPATEMADQQATGTGSTSRS